MEVGRTKTPSKTTMTDDIPTTLKDAVAHENDADKETLILGAEIGGIYQEVIVTKDWYENQMQP